MRRIIPQSAVLRQPDRHDLTFCLGDDFDLASMNLGDAVQKRIRHKKGSRWWKTDLVIEDIKAITPLLEAAYQNITK